MKQTNKHTLKKIFIALRLQFFSLLMITCLKKNINNNSNKQTNKPNTFVIIIFYN